MTSFCKDRGIDITLPKLVHVQQPRSYSAFLKIPPEVSKQYLILNEAFSFWEEDSGFIIRFTDWNIFSSDSGIVNIVNGFRQFHGERRPLSEAPWHWFESNEKDVALAFAQIITAFKWGGVFLSSALQSVIWELCDEHLVLTAKDQVIFERVTKTMRKTGTRFWVKK